MDAAGRVTIPLEIRERAGLIAGGVLEIRVRNGKIEIEAGSDRGIAADESEDESNADARVPTAVGAGTGAASASGAASAKRDEGSGVTRAFAVVKRSGTGGTATALETATASAAALARADRPQLDMLIRMAIAHRRQVELVYAGRPRLVEPHDYGLRGGEPQLLVFQKSGESRSGQPTGWRSLRLAEITDFRVLEATFPGRRPADSHIAWDVLFVRVDEP